MSGKHSLENKHKSKNKPKVKKGIFKIFLVIFLVLFLLLTGFYVFINQKYNINIFDKLLNIESKKEENIISYNGYSATLDDGSKKDISEKIKETHQVENIENITTSNLTITCTNEVSKIKGTIKNSSKHDIEAFTTMLNLIDKDGSSITELKVKIKSIPANSEISFSALTTIDLTNSYGYTIRAVN